MDVVLVRTWAAGRENCLVNGHAKTKGKPWRGEKGESTL